MERKEQTSDPTMRAGEPDETTTRLPVPAQSSLIPASFARNVSSPPHDGTCYECCLTCCGSCCGCIGSYVPGCCCFNPYQTVPQGMVGILSKFGRAYRVVDPGMYFINRETDGIELVDIRVRITDVPRQMVMTKDNVTIDIDPVIYWHVMDPYVATYHVQNVTTVLIECTQTTMRDTIGSHTLQNVVENREILARSIRKIIDGISRSWGVTVEAILIKDLKFSADLQETLSSAAKQQRLGESRVIAARAEVEASKLLREASDILNTPVAMQMRYLDTLNSMAKSSNAKIIFMPTNSDDMARRAVQASGMEHMGAK